MAGYIANEEESCQGNFIKLAIEPNSQFLHCQHSGKAIQPAFSNPLTPAASATKS